MDVDSLSRTSSQACLENHSEANSTNQMLSENGICPHLASHHYHYIQYAYEVPAVTEASPPATADLACHCHCHACVRQEGSAATSGDSGPVAVAVTVHRQASGQKGQSQQSLLNHSYEALQLQSCTAATASAGKTLAYNCDCDLECHCENRLANDNLNKLASKSAAPPADAMLGLDEITVSESDNNSTIVKKKKRSTKQLLVN